MALGNVATLYKPSKWGAQFHNLPDWEALGAGAAGPGKSIVLLMDPMPQIMLEHERATDPTHPHHHGLGQSTGAALHLRRIRPMLEESIRRAHRIFPRIDPGIKWNEQKTTYTWSSGYTFQFGHCKDPNDWEIYQSNEYTHVAFDELVQFDEEQYDEIGTRVRTDDPLLMPMMKIRSASNPLIARQSSDTFAVKNPHWVRDRFVKPEPQGGVRFWKSIHMQDGTIERRSFIYLRATLYDNPDPMFVRQYEINLRDKPPHIVQAMLYGNWFVTPGSFFGAEWNDNLHTCAPFRIPPDWRRFRSMDWGYKNPGCVHWWALDHDDTLYCEYEFTFKGQTDAEVATRIREIESAPHMKLWKDSRSRLTGPADTQLWEERGESAKTKAAVMAGKGVNWVPADKKSRIHSAELLMKRLKAHGGGTKAPGIVFFRTCKQAIATIPAIQTDPHDSECPQDGGEDHWFDSVRYACAYASHGEKGIPRHDRDEDDDHDRQERRGRALERPRGTWGYGGF